LHNRRPAAQAYGGEVEVEGEGEEGEGEGEEGEGEEGEVLFVR